MTTHDKVDEAQELRLYLLGSLPEERAHLIEERLFDSDATHESLCAVESELMDEYVRGELSATERAQLEQGVLATVEGQARLEFARTLQAGVAIDARRVDGERSRSIWRRLWSLLWPESAVSRAGVLAACTAVAVVVGLRMFSAVPSSPDNEIRVVVLNPVATRAAGSAATVATANARTLRITLSLGDEPMPARYRVEVRRGARLVHAVSAAAADQTLVEFDLPASGLARGRYHIALFNVVAQPAVPVAHYYVDVVD